MKWLRELLARVEAVSEKDVENQEPKEKLGEGEEVIGEVSIDLRKLYAYRGLLIDKIKVLGEQHDKDHKSLDHTRRMCEEFNVSLSVITDEVEVTGKALWQEIRSESKVNFNGIGIRKGWKVVKLPEKKSSIIEELSMLEGIGALGDLLRLRATLP